MWWMQKRSGYFREGCRTCSGRLQRMRMRSGEIYFRRDSNYGIIHWWTGDLIKRAAMKGLSWRIVRPQGALMRGSISGMGDSVKDICLATTNNEWLIASLCFVLCEHSWCSGVYMFCIFSPGTIQKNWWLHHECQIVHPVLFLQCTWFNRWFSPMWITPQM